MDIPQFPDSRPILLEDKPMFDAIFAADPPYLSAYSFTNLYAWAIPYGTTISRLNDHIIVHHEVEGRKILLEPLGSGDVKEAIEECFHRGPAHFCEFERVSERTAKMLAGNSNYQVEKDRNDSDYVYLTDDLIYLQGRKYDAKRNFINRFKSEYDYEYVHMDADAAGECLQFAHEWCEERSCETVDGLKREQCAVYQMLTHFDDLDICGGAIRACGKIVAFTLGEALNPETMVIHVEKADSNIAGLYQVINNEFASHEARPYKYINREQDLGLPGLRKAKQSYHPVKMIDAYRIRRA